MSSLEFETLSRDLQGNAKLEEPGRCYYDEGYSTPEDWKLLGSPSMFKVKLCGPECFVKMFAPITGNYAETFARTVGELSTLNIEPPILPPLSQNNRVVFFNVGKPVIQVPLEAVYSSSTVELLKEIVQRRGLVPLNNVDNIGLVDVRGRIYVTDPVDDSEDALLGYISSRSSE